MKVHWWKVDGGWQLLIDWTVAFSIGWDCCWEWRKSSSCWLSKVDTFLLVMEGKSLPDLGHWHRRVWELPLKAFPTPILVEISFINLHTWYWINVCIWYSDWTSEGQCNRYQTLPPENYWYSELGISLIFGSLLQYHVRNLSVFRSVVLRILAILVVSHCGFNTYLSDYYWC